MGAPAAGGGGGDDDDVAYLLCTEDASAGCFQLQLQGNVASMSSSSSSTAAPDAGCAGGDDVAGDEDEASVAELIGGEAEHSPRVDYHGRLRQIDLAARAGSVAWILKVRELYGLLPVTTYLAVSYMDRFLSLHRLPDPGNGWAMQLLAVTCLSLAIKMEETMMPSILDLQIEGTRYIFEPRTIFRMELLVLDALDWRLRSITPFTFMYFFAYKVDSTGKHIRGLIDRATQVTLATMHDTEFLDHCPSSIAAAAVLCASSEITQLASIIDDVISWGIIGLDGEAITRCYQLMLQLIGTNIQRESTLLFSIKEEEDVTRDLTEFDAALLSVGIAHYSGYRSRAALLITKAEFCFCDVLVLHFYPQFSA
uniref:Cyclin N-terminal domain-containing protein n=1 Tax=Leersia perrieri TaxID=77586 RepID=A0A0D9X7W7_9ORYZ